MAALSARVKHLEVSPLGWINLGSPLGFGVGPGGKGVVVGGTGVVVVGGGGGVDPTGSVVQV